MLTRQISKQEWRSTLDSLSRTYAGSIVSLEVAGGEVGAEEQLRNQPLRGITSDRSGVSVIVEKKDGIHIGHRIAQPEIVRLVETSDGSVMAVEIEETDGTCSLIRFRSAVRPEVLDAAVE